MAGGMLDAADLGLCAEDEQCQGLAEELGSQPPWSLASLKALFDSRFPGWDEAPVLAVSSPLSRLRGLPEAFPSHASGGEAEVEALRDLSREVKHAQIRVMCPRAEGNVLQEECNFLLIVLEQVGARLCAERDAHRNEAEAAAEKLTLTRDSLRKAGSESLAAAKEETRSQLEELMGEAEAQRVRADRLQKEMEGQEKHVRGMEARLDELVSETAHWRKAHDKIQEDLYDARSQRSAIAVAHEESEGALMELQRRIDSGHLVSAASSGPSSSEPLLSSTVIAAETAIAPVAIDQSKMGCPGKAFARGARAALSFHGPLSEAHLRPCFLAWRCARLQGIQTKVSSASLEADLIKGGCSGDGCCCGGDTACCRAKWLNAALKMLREERSSRFLADSAVQTLQQHWRTHKTRLLGAATTVPFALLAALVALEPHLSDGPR